jgi:hypothetical protein
MTAKELIDDLRLLGPQDANVIFQYLADHIYEAELSTPPTRPLRRVRDACDFKEWLLELAEAAKLPLGLTKAPRAPTPQLSLTQNLAQQPRRDHTCPDCGHEHEGRTDCGKYLGEGKFCPCETRVMA